MKHSASIRSRLTKLGWFSCIGAAMLLATAFLLDQAYAVLFGCMLALACLLSFLFGRRQLKTLRSRWLLPPSPHAGQFNTIGAELKANSAHYPYTLHAYEPRSESLQLVSAVPGSSKENSRITWPIYFPKRGQIALPPMRITCQLPFAMVENSCEVSEISRIIVLPAIGQLRKELHISLEHWLHQNRLPTSRGNDELVRLRNYQHGDSPRLVHWRASARSRQLIVSVRSDINDIHIALVLDCTSKQKNSRRFERLISMAASIVDHACRQGWSISLHGHFTPAQGLFQSRQDLMESLALAQSRSNDQVDDYIPKHTSCLLLTLREELDHQFDPRLVKVLRLGDLEQHIALARERR